MVMALTSALSACAMDEETVLKSKFKGINGVVLRLDSSGEKRYIKITNEFDVRIAAPAGLSNKGHQNLASMGNTLPIPKSVRATWREGAHSVWGKDGGIDWEGGAIRGDYTIPVASRIPDEVLDYVRARRRPERVAGRTLRIKIRLMDDGVLLGWDVEESVWNPDRRDGQFLRYQMAGGDFKEAKIYNGKVADRGWHISREGKKIETDY